MGAHGSAPLLGTERDRRWLLRGVVAGAGTFIVAVLVSVTIVTAMIGDAGFGWDGRKALTAMLFTALWCVAAGVAGAIGAWQAAEGGAPHHAAARFAGALGPVVLIVVVSLASLSGSGASSAAIVAEAIVEVAAAVVGARVLAERLETGW